MVLPPEEPDFGPWEVISLQTFTESLQRALPKDSRRPNVVAIDGRGGSGKSTLAALLQQAVPGSALIHTDDVPSSGNWHEKDAVFTPDTHPSLFDWTDALLENVLEPAHAGKAVRYRPQAWDDWGRERESAVEVPLGCPVLIVEGVGAARSELTHLTDVVIWVQADVERAQARGIARDGGGAGAIALWDTWNAQEFPFQAEQRPWERADFVICGTPTIEHDAASEVVVAVPSS